MNPMNRPTHPIPLLPLLLALTLAAAPLAFAADNNAEGASSSTSDSTSDRDETMIQALLRLDNVNLDESPRLKKVVLRYLDNHQGTERFLDLIDRFDIREMDAQLLEMALDQPDQTRGVRAAELLLDHDGGLDRFAKAVDADDPDRARAALTALGYTGRDPALALVTETALDTDRPKPLRVRAVRALGRTTDGQRRLLALVTDGKLPEDLRFTAGSVLRASQDPQIRNEAAEHLEPPASADDEPLPPVSELVEQDGDPESGRRVFMQLCITCHRIDGVGTEFGPDLSEIGDKLAKRDMFTAILDPSAAISHGYHGRRVKLEDGGEVIGYIVSETEDKLTLRMVGGVDRTVDKSAIASRSKMEQSLMTPGLQRAMTRQQLVDLVEYLTTLTKPDDNDDTDTNSDANPDASDN